MYRFSVEADWSSMHHASWAKLLQRINPQEEQHLIEIGCFEGRSSVWFADNYLHHPKSTLTCIDTWQGGEEVERKHLTYDFDLIEANFRHNVAQCRYADKINVYKDASLNVLRSLVSHDRQYSFVYIDGSHKAQDVFYDVALSYLILKPLGVVVCDDYFNNMATSKPHLKVAPGVDPFCELFADKIKIGRTNQRQFFFVKRP